MQLLARLEVQNHRSALGAVNDSPLAVRRDTETADRNAYLPTAGGFERETANLLAD